MLFEVCPKNKMFPQGCGLAVCGAKGEVSYRQTFGEPAWGLVESFPADQAQPVLPLWPGT